MACPPSFLTSPSPPAAAANCALSLSLLLSRWILLSEKRGLRREQLTFSCRVGPCLLGPLFLWSSMRAGAVHTAEDAWRGSDVREASTQELILSRKTRKHIGSEMILRDVSRGAAVTVAVVRGEDPLSVVSWGEKCSLHFPVISSLSRNVIPSFLRPTVIFSSHFFDGASAQILSLSLSLRPSLMCTNFFFLSISAQQPPPSASDFALILPPSLSSFLHLLPPPPSRPRVVLSPRADVESP